MLLLGRRLRQPPGFDLLVGPRSRPNWPRWLLQANLAIVADTAILHIVAIAYLAAIALDEIDFRDLLGLSPNGGSSASQCRSVMGWFAPTAMA